LDTIEGDMKLQTYIIRNIFFPSVSATQMIKEKMLTNQNYYDSVEIPTNCSFVIEFIIPNFTEESTCFERHTTHQ